MPEPTLKALNERETILTDDLSSQTEEIAPFTKAEIDTDSLASQLRVEGAASFVKYWTDLMSCIKAKGEKLKAT